MVNPFTARRSWAAAVIALVFSPFLVMLYLGRGTWALVYLALLLLAVAATFLLFPSGLFGLPQLDLLQVATWALTLAGAVHAYRLARRWSAAESGRWYARWYVLLAIVAAPMALALGLRTYLYQPFDLPSSSMSPSLNSGDFILVAKSAYAGASPRRGDIVVFLAPSGATYVKRIVGLPGERVQLRSGVLFIDGIPAKRRRVADWTETDLLGSAQHVARFEETLPGGRTDLVLDRYASNGDDTAVFRVPAGSYFVLGDNRDNSDDSRFDVGYVARDRILGRVAFKFAEKGHWTWQAID